MDKAQNIVLNEFRAGKLGLITLDEVPSDREAFPTGKGESEHASE